MKIYTLNTSTPLTYPDVQRAQRIRAHAEGFIRSAYYQSAYSVADAMEARVDARDWDGIVRYLNDRSNFALSVRKPICIRCGREGCS